MHTTTKTISFDWTNHYNKDTKNETRGRLESIYIPRTHYKMNKKTSDDNFRELFNTMDFTHQNLNKDFMTNEKNYK